MESPVFQVNTTKKKIDRSSKRMYIPNPQMASSTVPTAANVCSRSLYTYESPVSLYEMDIKARYGDVALGGHPLTH